MHIEQSACTKSELVTLETRKQHICCFPFCKPIHTLEWCRRKQNPRNCYTRRNTWSIRNLETALSAA